MEVTAESNSQFVAFRRFVYRLSQQLSREEAQAIVYIYFFEQKDSFSSASTLDILCKLETSGIATFTNPEKLLELMKDLKRHDLASDVKDFLSKRRKLSKKSSSLGRKQKWATISDFENEDEEDLILRNTLEAALVQATVLLQHMEMLQVSISGGKVKREGIKEVVTEAAQTCEALAERLRRAEVTVHQDQDQGSSNRSSILESKELQQRVGYVNAPHTDHFTKLMSSSVPTNLSRSYGVSSAARTHPVVAQALRAKEKEREERVENSDDEDDYEPMNVGVSAVDIEEWEEKRKSFTPNDYVVSLRDRTKTEGSITSPVHYSSILVPPPKPVAAKPQKYTDAKRNSKPINYVPVFPAKPGSNSKTKNLVPILEDVPHHTTGRLTQSVYVDTTSQQLISDDNYTTLHRTPPRGQLQKLKDPSTSSHYYKSLQQEGTLPAVLYTPVQRNREI